MVKSKNTTSIAWIQDEKQRTLGTAWKWNEKNI